MTSCTYCDKDGKYSYGYRVMNGRLVMFPMCKEHFELITGNSVCEIHEGELK